MTLSDIWQKLRETADSLDARLTNYNDVWIPRMLCCTVQDPAAHTCSLTFKGLMMRQWTGKGQAIHMPCWDTELGSITDQWLWTHRRQLNAEVRWKTLNNLWMQCAGITLLMIAGSVEYVDWYTSVLNKYPAYGIKCSKCGCKHHWKVMCQSCIPHSHLQEIGAPPTDVSESVVANKRKAAVLGPMRGITREEMQPNPRRQQNQCHSSSQQ